MNNLFWTVPVAALLAVYVVSTIQRLFTERAKQWAAIMENAFAVDPSGDHLSMWHDPSPAKSDILLDAVEAHAEQQAEQTRDERAQP